MIDAVVTVETQRLDGLALEWAGGTAAGMDLIVTPTGIESQPWAVNFSHFRMQSFAPLTKPEQMWPLVDAHIQELRDCSEPECGWAQIADGKQYVATVDLNTIGIGSSKGVAVLRALVQWKYGYTVNVPAVLVMPQ